MILNYHDILITNHVYTPRPETSENDYLPQRVEIDKFTDKGIFKEYYFNQEKISLSQSPNCEYSVFSSKDEFRLLNDKKSQ